MKWTLLNSRKDPHKGALREFLKLMSGKSPDQKTVNHCITDAKGQQIILAKPNPAASNYYRDFEEIIKNTR